MPPSLGQEVEVDISKKPRGPRNLLKWGEGGIHIFVTRTRWVNHT